MDTGNIVVRSKRTAITLFTLGLLTFVLTSVWLLTATSFGFWVSTVCLSIISVTMLARANDLRWKKGLIGTSRLIGFILAGFAPFGMVIYDFLLHTYPGLYECLFRFGLMLVFVTTPYLPPWWKWIIGWDPTAHVVWTDDRRKPRDD